MNVQTITIAGTITAGTFKLGYNGTFTADIAYNATAAAITTALEALTCFGTGGIVVTGDAGGPFTVTGKLGYRMEFMDKLQIDVSGLTTATGATVTQVWTEVGHKDDGVKANLSQKATDLMTDEHRAAVDYMLVEEGGDISCNLNMARLDRLGMALNGTTYSSVVASTGQVGYEKLTFGDGAAKAFQQAVVVGTNGLGYVWMCHFYKVAPNPNGAFGQEFKKDGKTLIPFKMQVYADMARTKGDTICAWYNITAPAA